MQITTAPIIIGFPKASFTFCFSLFNVITLVDIFFFVTPATFAELLPLASEEISKIFPVVSSLGTTALQNGFIK